MRSKTLSRLFLFGVLLSLCNCTGCSSRQSRHERTSRNSAIDIRNDKSSRLTRSRSGTSIQMINEGGVYKVPIAINGVTLNFIFDTGASDICISPAEAAVLFRQGTLSENDVIGKEQYSIADGSVAEAVSVRLKSVTIGNRTIHNVKASIIDSETAPLLLGQSALCKFGEISIDYERRVIKFE
ncbi:MAG: retropepsin-like aspartic protease [Bacteroidota bacterium]|nr:retropepsin-like aspartic protease [Bacteroidota bacterium]